MEKRRNKAKKGIKGIALKLLLTLFLSAALILLIYFSFGVFPYGEPEDGLSNYIKKKEFVIFSEDFYDKEKYDISYMWLSKNGTITLVIPYEQLIRVGFVPWSYNKPVNTKLYLNDYMLTELNVTRDRSNYTSPYIYLKRGIYELKFLNSEDCQVPALVENSGDTRCLTIAVGDFKKTEITNLVSFVDAPGWHSLESYYGKDMRWVEENGIIKLVNIEKDEYSLEFFTFSFYFNRELNVYVDDMLVHSSIITPQGNDVKVKMSLAPGLHTIKFDAGSCDYPLKLGLGTDARCLSIAIVRPIIYVSD